jgi:hypothetical protein
MGSMSQTKPFRYDKMFGDAPGKPAPYDPISHVSPAAAPSKAQLQPSDASADAPRLATDNAQGSVGMGGAVSDAAGLSEHVSEASPTPPHPPPVPLFSPATKPILDTVGTHSIRLFWEAQRQTGLTGEVPPGASLPPCAITYALQMQEVRMPQHACLAHAARCPASCVHCWRALMAFGAETSQVQHKKSGEELPLDEDAWVKVYQDAAASAEVGSNVH